MPCQITVLSLLPPRQAPLPLILVLAVVLALILHLISCLQHLHQNHLHLPLPVAPRTQSQLQAALLEESLVQPRSESLPSFLVEELAALHLQQMIVRVTVWAQGKPLP